MPAPPRNLFIAIWAALLTLLFSWFGLSHFNIGPAGTAVILTLAVCQMLLVIAFFM
ncbi:MAG: hypothetical protein KGR98_04870 [Verrucomicrobia bacterium]|nr:hypothetical protein [Verrucomicrobiota bacterium]MDE3098917.1 hypothetical protein [Verrucomicrobiota bacterium]